MLSFQSVIAPFQGWCASPKGCGPLPEDAAQEVTETVTTVPVDNGVEEGWCASPDGCGPVDTTGAESGAYVEPDLNDVQVTDIGDIGSNSPVIENQNNGFGSQIQDVVDSGIDTGMNSLVDALVTLGIKFALWAVLFGCLFAIVKWVFKAVKNSGVPALNSVMEKAKKDAAAYLPDVDRRDAIHRKAERARILAEKRLANRSIELSSAGHVPGDSPGARAMNEALDAADKSVHSMLNGVSGGIEIPIFDLDGFISNMERERTANRTISLEDLSRIASSSTSPELATNPREQQAKAQESYRRIKQMYEEELESFEEDTPREPKPSPRRAARSIRY